MTPEYFIGLGVTLLIGLVGWLLNRSITGIDKKLDTTCNAVEAMKLEMVGYQKLAEYLKADVDTMKAENHTLRKSFYQMDKIIYGLGLATNHPVPPPRP